MSTVDCIEAIPDACNPRLVIPADDPNHYYVDCWEVRGGGAINRVERLIRSSSTSTHQLITGHTGCGKSTEILRLKAELEKEKNGNKFKTLFFDADKKLDMSNVVFVDILLALGEQLESLEKELEIKSFPSWNRMVDELRKLIQDSEFTFKIGLLSIKSGGDKRKELRNVFGNYLAQIVKRINEVIVELRDCVKKQGYKDLVFIIDNLEKIIPIEQDKHGKTNHESIFVDKASLLTDLDIHLLLTVPLSLCHLSLSASRLGSLYDGEPTVIPMIKIWDRKSNRAYDKGINILKEILARRIQLDKIFDSEDTVLEICRKSGGAVRDLLRIVRTASLYCDEKPITMKEANHTIKEISNGYNRVVGRFLDVLKYVNNNKQFQNDVDLGMKKAALHELYVLEYYNGEQWYDVHPIIRETSVFKDALKS